MKVFFRFHNKIVLLLSFLLFNISAYGQILINEVMASNVDCYLSPATNFDSWIELYNSSTEEFQLSGCYISDSQQNHKKWQCPQTMPKVPAKGYLVIWFDSNDINNCQPPFKLDVDGGYIGLFDEDGLIICDINYPKSIQRTSYARKMNGEEWGITEHPTPGSENRNEGYGIQQLEMPILSRESAFFSDNIDFQVSYPEGSSLIYTLDGTTPTRSNGSISQNGQFHFDKSTNIKLRLFCDGYLPSNVVTRSFIRKDHNYNLPVISVVTDDAYLYDDSIGVMVEGTNGKIAYGLNYPCNWNMEWERPVNFTYFNEKGDYLYSNDAYLEISGKYSRRFDPKSYKLKGNKIFGQKLLEYPFFVQKPYIRNRTILLRNGGNDYQCRIKDAALSTIIQRSGLDVDLQSYQPVVQYINGECRGLINMREPNNKHFVFANYGYDDDEIDMFETYAQWIVLLGNDDKMNELCELSKNSINEEVYKEIGELIDLDELINYMAVRLYLGSDDWPHNNCKGFCPQESGKFRLILFDLDNSFKIKEMFKRLVYVHEEYIAHNRELKIVSVFMNLLENEKFRRKFIDTYCIVGGSVFERQSSFSIIDEIAQRVEPALARENISPWTTAQAIKDSLSVRNEMMIQDLLSFDKARVTDLMPLKYRIKSNIESARLFVGDVQIPNCYFDGQLFPGFTLSIKEPYGYEFEYWANEDNGSVFSVDSVIEDPSQPLNLIAVFRKKEVTDGIHNIVINELSASNNRYISDYFKKSDWVELYNASSEDVDLDGYFLSNDQSNLHLYKIDGGFNTVNTIIPAHGYKVLWCDKKEPLSQLHVPFKLSASGGELYLTSPNDEYTDRINYPAHDSSITIGRFPDGVDCLYKMNVPTIGERNIYTSYIEEVESGISTRISSPSGQISDFSCSYSNGFIIISTEGQYRIFLYNMSGQCCYKSANIEMGQTKINIGKYGKGAYVVKIVNGMEYEYITKIVF